MHVWLAWLSIIIETDLRHVGHMRDWHIAHCKDRAKCRAVVLSAVQHCCYCCPVDLYRVDPHMAYMAGLPMFSCLAK